MVDASQTQPVNASVSNFAWCSGADDRDLFGGKVVLRRVSNDSAHEDQAPQGRWIGLLNVRGAGRERLQKMVATLRMRPDFDALDLPALLNALIDAGEEIEVQYVHRHWRSVNDLEDFRRAGDCAHAQAPFAIRTVAGG